MAKNDDGFEAGAAVSNDELYLHLAKMRSKAPAVDLTDLRAEYADTVGKKPYHGWDADELTAKIAEAKSGADD